MLPVFVILGLFAIFFSLLLWATHAHTESPGPQEGEF